MRFLAGSSGGMHPLSLIPQYDGKFNMPISRSSQRLRIAPEWSNWVIILVVVLLAVALILYLLSAGVT
jgi:hypothetical protein